ncbi:MAG: dihydroorotate dehydrogenase electron transfer subunit [Candidatus Eisenbacteria bacterium]|nr:dihydroorotate dehydrogenase electron transfer subunit [Candidatus Eisenbacteria bacterium]
MTPGQTDRPKEIEAEVMENRRVSESGFLLSLRGKIPAPRPGQFVMLGLPEGAGPFLRRPFSVLDFGSGEETLQIYYSVSGLGTKILSGIRPGKKMELLGPLGRAFPLGSREIEVMVGGGRGVSPLIFLSRERSGSRRVIFFVGAAREDEIVFLDRVKADKIFVSTEDGSLGKKGTVMELLRGAASSSGLEWSRAALYGCGPAGMLKRLHEFSIEYDVPCFVSLEARMGCGVGACQGCAVMTVTSANSARGANVATASKAGYSLVCRDGPVFSSASVDWDNYEGPSFAGSCSELA